MLFSVPCEYAIRALTFLAGQEVGRPISLNIIAENADVPNKFLAKVLLTLKNHNLLKTVKGPGGGYFLARPASDITLKEISHAMDSPTKTTAKCVLGLDMCLDSHPCPLHFEWKRFRREVDTQINHLSVLDLYEKLKEKKAHLKV